MRTYSVSQFKAHALGVIKGIAETGETIVVSRRGKPMVRVVPYLGREGSAAAGKMSGTIAFEEDIVSPAESGGDVEGGQGR